MDVKQTRAKKVFAHFMPAHGGGGSHSYHKSLIGEHDGRDADAIEYQILCAKAAHLDGFIINPTHFEGRANAMNERTLAIIDKICELNGARPDFNFKYIFSYDDNGIANGDRDIIHKNYEWVRDNILFHPVRSKACFTDDLTGKKVMMVWSGDGRAWHWEAAGRHLGRDRVMLLLRDTWGADEADGYFTWFFGVPNRSPEKTDGERNRLWGDAEFDSFFEDVKKYPDKVFFGSAYPGFDDRYAPWGEGWRFIARDVPEGETFALTWEKIMGFNATNPDIEIPWVQVVTWNDWPEGTAVEPASLDGYGFRATETCREYCVKFKNETCLRPDDAKGLMIPYKILLLRRAGRDDTADETLGCFLDGRYQDAWKIM